MTAGILDPSPAMAGAQLSSTEQDLISRIDADTKNAHTLAKVAGVLGASMFVYRMYMRRRLREEMKETLPEKLPVIAGAVFGSFLPSWVHVIAPAVLAGYLEGHRAVKLGKVPEPYLRDVAETYARELGEHINEVSYDAMMQGFHAQVNRRVPARRAMENVISAYGVPARTMNALVKIWTGEDNKVLSRSPSPSKRDQKAASLIERAFKLRSEQFGDTEAWTASRQGKQITWMYNLSKGTLPPGTTRVWRTARDERVCPSCGPLDKTEVPLDQPFITDMGEYWSPPLHPKCRCDIDLAMSITLAVKESVGKAMGDDPFDRDRRGRFARDEARLAPEVARPDFEPAPVRRTAREVAEEYRRLKKTKKKPSFKPVSLGGPKLGGVSFKPVDFSAKETPQLGKPDLGQKPDFTQPRPIIGREKPVIQKPPLKLPAFKGLELDFPTLAFGPTPKGVVRLAVPVYGIKASDEIGVDIYTGPSERVYERSELDTALTAYWDAVKEKDMMMTFGREGHITYEDPHWPDHTMHVEKAIYGYVWNDALSADRNQLHRETYPVLIIDNNTGREFYFDVSAYELAQENGILEELEEKKPVVFKMQHGWPDGTNTKPGQHGPDVMRYNEGNWQIQGEIVDDSLLSEYPHYQRAYVTPIA